MSKNGKIVQVIGAVVDAAFPIDSVPEIFDAITINYQVSGAAKSLTLEVQQHLGDGLVRAVAMTSTDGLVRGMEVVGTGSPISVPVGEAVLGRIFNVTGDTVDEKGPVATDERRPIHRQPPELIDQATEAEILETGIAGVWLVTHYNTEEEILGRYIEICRIPAILESQDQDIEYGLDEMEALLETR